MMPSVFPLEPLPYGTKKWSGKTSPFKDKTNPIIVGTGVPGSSEGAVG